MMTMTIPVTDRQLAARVEAIIAERIKPSFTAGYEYIRASANEQGEIHLYGLVHDARLAEEAVQLVQTLPGVRFVFNDVGTLCVGCEIDL